MAKNPASGALTAEIQVLITPVMDEAALSSVFTSFRQRASNVVGGAMTPDAPTNPATMGALGTWAVQQQSGAMPVAHPAYGRSFGPVVPPEVLMRTLNEWVHSKVSTLQAGYTTARRDATTRAEEVARAQAYLAKHANEPSDPRLAAITDDDPVAGQMFAADYVRAQVMTAGPYDERIVQRSKKKDLEGYKAHYASVLRKLDTSQWTTPGAITAGQATLKLLTTKIEDKPGSDFYLPDADDFDQWAMRIVRQVEAKEKKLAKMQRLVAKGTTDVERRAAQLASEINKYGIALQRVEKMLDVVANPSKLRTQRDIVNLRKQGLSEIGDLGKLEGMGVLTEQFSATVAGREAQILREAYTKKKAAAEKALAAAAAKPLNQQAADTAAKRVAAAQSALRKVVSAASARPGELDSEIDEFAHTEAMALAAKQRELDLKKRGATHATALAEGNARMTEMRDMLSGKKPFDPARFAVLAGDARGALNEANRTSKGKTEEKAAFNARVEHQRLVNEAAERRKKTKAAPDPRAALDRVKAVVSAISASSDVDEIQAGLDEIGMLKAQHMKAWMADAGMKKEFIAANAKVRKDVKPQQRVLQAAETRTLSAEEQAAKNRVDAQMTSLRNGAVLGDGDYRQFLRDLRYLRQMSGGVGAQALDDLKVEAQTLHRANRPTQRAQAAAAHLSTAAAEIAGARSDEEARQLHARAQAAFRTLTRDGYDPLAHATITDQLAAARGAYEQRRPSRGGAGGRGGTTNVNIGGDFHTRLALGYQGAMRGGSHISNQVSNMLRHMGIPIYGLGFLGAGTLALGSIRGAVRSYTDLEKTELMLAGILQTFNQFEAPQGQTALTPGENFAAAMTYARGVYPRMRQMAVESPLTAKELVDTFSTSYPFLARKGVGVDSAMRMTNIIASLGKMMGLRPESIRDDIRAVVTGHYKNVQTFQAAGIGPEEFRRISKLRGPAFEEAFTEAFSGYADALEKFNDTLTSKMDRVSDKFIQTGQVFGERLAESLTGASDDIVKALDRWDQTGVLDRLADLTSKGIGVAMRFVEFLAENANEILNIMGMVIGAKVIGGIARGTGGAYKAMTGRSMLQNQRLTPAQQVALEARARTTAEAEAISAGHVAGTPAFDDYVAGQVAIAVAANAYGPMARLAQRVGTRMPGLVGKGLTSAAVGAMAPSAILGGMVARAGLVGLSAYGLYEAGKTLYEFNVNDDLESTFLGRMSKKIGMMQGRRMLDRTAISDYESWIEQTNTPSDALYMQTIDRLTGLLGPEKREDAYVELRRLKLQARALDEGPGTLGPAEWAIRARQGAVGAVIAKNQRAVLAEAYGADWDSPARREEMFEQAFGTAALRNQITMRAAVEAEDEIRRRWSATLVRKTGGSGRVPTIWAGGQDIDVTGWYTVSPGFPGAVVDQRAFEGNRSYVSPKAYQEYLDKEVQRQLREATANALMATPRALDVFSRRVLPSMSFKNVQGFELTDITNVTLQEVPASTVKATENIGKTRERMMSLDAAAEKRQSRISYLMAAGKFDEARNEAFKVISDIQEAERVQLELAKAEFDKALLQYAPALPQEQLAIIKTNMDTTFLTSMSDVFDVQKLLLEASKAAKGVFSGIPGAETASNVYSRLTSQAFLDAFVNLRREEVPPLRTGLPPGLTPGLKGPIGSGSTGPRAQVPVTVQPEPVITPLTAFKLTPSEMVAINEKVYRVYQQLAARTDASGERSPMASVDYSKVDVNARSRALAFAVWNKSTGKYDARQEQHIIGLLLGEEDPNQMVFNSTAQGLFGPTAGVLPDEAKNVISAAVSTVTADSNLSLAHLNVNIEQHKRALAAMKVNKENNIATLQVEANLKAAQIKLDSRKRALAALYEGVLPVYTAQAEQEGLIGLARMERAMLRDEPMPWDYDGMLRSVDMQRDYKAAQAQHEWTLNLMRLAGQQGSELTVGPGFFGQSFDGELTLMEFVERFGAQITADPTGFGAALTERMQNSSLVGTGAVSLFQNKMDMVAAEAAIQRRAIERQRYTQQVDWRRRSFFDDIAREQIGAPTGLEAQLARMQTAYRQTSAFDASAFELLTFLGAPPEARKAFQLRMKEAQTQFMSQEDMLKRQIAQRDFGWALDSTRYARATTGDMRKASRIGLLQGLAQLAQGEDIETLQRYIGQLPEGVLTPEIADMAKGFKGPSVDLVLAIEKLIRALEQASDKIAGQLDYRNFLTGRAISDAIDRPVMTPMSRMQRQWAEQDAQDALKVSQMSENSVDAGLRIAGYNEEQIQSMSPDQKRAALRQQYALGRSGRRGAERAATLKAEGRRDSYASASNAFLSSIYGKTGDPFAAAAATVRTDFSIFGDALAEGDLFRMLFQRDPAGLSDVEKQSYAQRKEALRQATGMLGAGVLVGAVFGSGQSNYSQEGMALGGMVGPSLFAGLGPYGAGAGALLGGLLGGLFGKSKPDPDKMKANELQRRMVDLLSSIDNRLKPAEDVFNTVRGAALWGSASFFTSGRYVGMGAQSLMGFV